VKTGFTGGNNEFNMVPDHKGRIWLRFGKKLVLAVPKTGGGYTIRETGLNPITELTIQAIFPEKDGIIWFCTTDGLVRYDENLERKDVDHFEAILRHISSGKGSLNVFEEGGAPAIDFENNTLRFEYAAFSLSRKRKQSTRTWLQGFEKDYSEFGNNYYKEFTNLPPVITPFMLGRRNVHDKKSAKEGIYHFTHIYRHGIAPGGLTCCMH
jgi:hypothetical protein